MRFVAGIVTIPVRPTLLIVLSATLTSWISCSDMAAADDLRIREEDQLRRRIANSTTYWELDQAYEALFAAPRHAGDFIGDSNPGIALEAAYRLSYTDQFLIHNPSRFVGFLEARAGLTVPVRWEARISRKYTHSELTERYRDKDKPDPYVRSQAGFFVPDGNSLTRTPRTLRFEGKSWVVEVNNEDFARAIGQYPKLDMVNVLVREDVAFVAVYNSDGKSFPLLGVERASHKTIWVARVWGNRFGEAADIAKEGSSAEGQGAFRVDLSTGNPNQSLERRLVVVFGSHPGAEHGIVEAFSEAQGRSVFRFLAYVPGMKTPRPWPRG